MSRRTSKHPSNNPAVRAIQTKRTASGESAIQHNMANYGQSIARQVITSTGEPPPEMTRSTFRFWSNVPPGPGTEIVCEALLDINLTDYNMALVVGEEDRARHTNDALAGLTRLIQEEFAASSAAPAPVIVRGTH